MSKLIRLIDESKNKELTINDIMSMSMGKFLVKADRDLNVNDVFQTIKDKAIIVLLLRGKSMNGHYVAITINDNNQAISMYDPYGFHLDALSDVAGQEIANFLFELQTALPRYKLEMNMTRIQKLNDNISTCGRYALMRCFCKKLSNAQFNELIEGPLILKNSDDIITAMTCWYDLMSL